MTPRWVSWFSCGAASAVATKIALGENPRAIVARCIVDNEHEDNSRFAADVARWLGVEIVELRSAKYADCWDVWSKRRYLNGPGGALCTVEMKKKVRQAFSNDDDCHIFGYTNEERGRVERFKINNPEITTRFPLIERDISKRECFEIIQHSGIELPITYRMGYSNANCIGCVKGGAGYWNKIRVDFPETFERMAQIEESIGASCLNGVRLRDLDPSAGRHDDIRLPDCGLFCGENEGWEWSDKLKSGDAMRDER